MSQWQDAEQESLLEGPEEDHVPDPEEEFSLSVVLEDEDEPFDIGTIDLTGLEGDLDEPPVPSEPVIRVNLAALEAAREGAVDTEVEVDVPIPPRPDAEDRFARLSVAGQTMRQGIRDEIQAAANQIFSLAVEQVRSELDAEVRRFEEDIRREVEGLKNDIRTRVAEDGFTSMEVERRLAELTEAVTETRDAVLGLKKRYLPGSANG